MSCGPVAIVVGDLYEAVGVSYLEPIGAWDSGFAVWPVPQDEVDEVEDMESELICLHCLVTKHPDLQTAFRLARECGGAELDKDRKWMAA